MAPARQRFALTCSMVLPDGRWLSGTIQSDSPLREAAVRYSGAVNLLPLHCATANTFVLRALFRSFAADFRAHYQEDLVEKHPNRAKPVPQRQ